MSKHLTLAILFAFTSFQMLSQANNYRSPSISVGFQVSDPQLEFKEQYKGNPRGIVVTYAHNLSQSPVDWLLDFSWNSMNSESREIAVYAGKDNEGDEIYEQGKLIFNSNIYSYHVGARFRPLKGRVQPYVDVLAGMKYFSSKRKIQVTHVAEDGKKTTQVLEKNNELRDHTWSSGWAAGVRFKLTDAIMIEGRFENLRGGGVDWADPNSIVIEEEDNIIFSTKTTATNAMKYQLGLCFSF